MTILALGGIFAMLILNILFAEFRFKRNIPEIDMGSRYTKLLLLRRYR